MSSQQLPTSLIGLTILGAALALAAWPEPRPDRSAPAAVEARLVRVAEVVVDSSPRDLRLPGVTRAARRATLSATLPARLAERPVDVGDEVHAGQLVARLEDRELALAESAAAAALAELEVRTAQARRDLERAERLAASRAATLEEVEQAEAAAAALEAARDAARARLDEARRRLGETLVTAPFAATVTAVHLEPGEWGRPGGPILELAGSGAVEVEVEAPEGLRERLRAGAGVTVELPFLGRQVNGRIAAVGGAARGAGGLFPVRIALVPGEGLVPGLAVEVALPLEASPELTVPLAAVVDPGSGTPSVFRVVGGRAERVQITPGRVLKDRLTVTAGLAAGDRVAISGHTALADDDPVEVR